MSEPIKSQTVIESLPQDDQNAVDSVIKDLIKQRYAEDATQEVGKGNVVENEKVVVDESFKKDASELPDEILAEESRELDREIADLTSTSVTERMTDDASGYDHGIVEKLREKIKEGKSKHLDVSHLERELTQVLSDMQRELESNANNKVETDIDQNNDISFNGDDYDSDNDIMEEAAKLAKKLLELGIAKTTDFVNGVDEYEITSETIANASKQGLMTNEIEERDDEGNLISLTVSTLLPKFYNGEKDPRKMTEEEKELVEKQIAENPEEVEIFTYAIADEKSVAELVKRSEETLCSKIHEAAKGIGSAIQSGLAGITDMFVGEENKISASEVLSNQDIPVATPYHSERDEGLVQAVASNVEEIPLAKVKQDDVHQENDKQKGSDLLNVEEEFSPTKLPNKSKESEERGR